MANPRQRRKARSSAHKPVRHSQRAQKMLKKQPPIRGPKAIQEAWDRQKTVKQNYARLGLAHSLAPTRPSDSGTRDDPDPAVALGSTSALRLTADARSTSDTAASGAIPKGFGRIRRDEDGNIVIVEMGEEREEASSRMEEDAEFVEEQVWNRPNAFASPGQRSRESEKTNVVGALETLARGGTQKTQYASAGEVGYLRGLVGKYGGDVEGMARDRKLNVQQKTAGELRRAVARAGGVEALAR